MGDSAQDCGRPDTLVLVLAMAVTPKPNDAQLAAGWQQLVDLEGSTQVWQTIQTIQTHFDGCKALNLAGNKDIVVVPGHPTQLPGLHRELHGSLDNGCRVETQVAWPQHVRDAPAPAA